MNIKSIKTKIVYKGDSVADLITSSVATIPEGSVIAIASKVIAYEQSQWLLKNDTDPHQKSQLVAQEADWYLPAHFSKYNLLLAVKNHTLTVNAGVDESNADGGLVLWPKDLQVYVNQLWQQLRTHYGVQQLGLVVTDSKTTPFRWGVTGTCLAHCGFAALYSYIGQPDLFGRPMVMEKTNVAEAVAAAATLEMGEAAESQPLAIITDITHCQFQDHAPTPQELADLRIEIADDVYGPLLTAVEWQKGGGGRP